MPALQGTANVLLTNDEIANEALRVLKNECVALRLVNRNLESKFGEIGDTISVRKPFRVQSTTGRTLGIKPMVDQTVALTIDQQRNIGLRFTTNDRSLSIAQFSERYIKPAVTQIAHQIDLSILTEAVNSTYFYSGTPGQGTTFETMIDARADATEVGVPDDGMNKYLLNPRDAASHRKALTNLNNEGMVKAAIERAYLGQLAGMDGYESAQMPTHTVGVATGTPKVYLANQTGASINTDGWTNSTTGILKKGDIITFDGVYAINPQTYQSTGQLMQFVVTADVDSGASTGPATIPISPAINDGTLTTVDGDGNTVSLAAYQNVSNAPANDADVNVLGTGGTTYRQNLMLHRDAITFAMISLHLPESANVAKRVHDAQTGLALTLTAAYDITEARETYRLDALWGVKNLYPELTRRIGGTSS